MHDYLAEAEATTSLRDCVLSIDPHQIGWTQGRPGLSAWLVYLSAIQQLVRMLTISPFIDLPAVFQDFGDGSGGSVYSMSLYTTYLSKSNSSYLKQIEKTHAISDILAHMEPRSISCLVWLFKWKIFLS